MKTYEEMAYSALARGKAIARQRKRISRIFLGAVSGLAACCLIVLLVWGIGGNQAKPGESEFLAVIRKTDPGMAGEAFPYMADMQYAQGDRSALSASRRFYFACGNINVVARVSEDLGRYEMLHEYGSWQGRAYRLLLMEVIDPLQSGLEGAFYYLLPERLQADLTGYDALLISMVQLPSDFTLRRGEELTAFAYLFADPWDTPELGNMLAFQNGVFDEKFWLDMGWFSETYYEYIWRGHGLIASEGSALEDALLQRQLQLEEMKNAGIPIDQEVKHTDFRTKEAQQVFRDCKPYKNAMFIPERTGEKYCLRRYIYGCPTNEYIEIDYDTETVTSAKNRFHKEDLKKLPNLSAYLQNIDLKQIHPQHTDTEGKILLYHSAMGWYEKTESGVYAIVRIVWEYQGDWLHTGDFGTYYDESFVLVDAAGDHPITREELIELIGENENISDWEYGEAFLMLK